MTRTQPSRIHRWLAIAAIMCVASLIDAASLPPHRSLRVLIVSDEVNPHGLSDAELTQPGELSAALSAPGSGLEIDPFPGGVLEVPTNEIEIATPLLLLPRSDPARYDALIYFAHRIPDNGNDPSGRQAAFTAAVESFLQNGGGVVSFHHGAYLTAGKEAIQEIIGATATGAVPWNTIDGQNVVNVAPGHFVTQQGVTYSGTVNYSDPALGIENDAYPWFNNTPDERYISFEINPGAGQIVVLFSSDYVQNGATHLLGFTHRRSDWIGRVVAYQPGEYQPNALDLNGNNFQILANAIVYSSRARLSDGIELTVDRGPGAGEVMLDWTAGQPSYSVFRSASAQAVLVPASKLGETASTSWSDAPPVQDLSFYLVIGN